MKIKGFQKTSLIDYPGNICSVIFISKCNFNCPFCYNPELVNDKGEELSKKEILDFLESKKKLIDGVCITGGEPTLHKELPEFIKKIKEKNLKVKLDTNGNNPEMLNYLIQNKLVDYIAMDIKNVFEKYKQTTNKEPDIEKLKNSIKIIIDSKIKHEFRTTILPKLHNKEDLIKIAKEYIPNAKKYFLQNFFPAEKMLDNSFLKEKPFSREALEDIKKACNKYIKTEIRNL